MKTLALHLAKRIFRALPISDRQRTALAFTLFRLTGDRLKHLPSYRLYLRDRRWSITAVPADLASYRAKVMGQYLDVPDSSEVGVPSKREAALAVGQSEARGRIPPPNKSILMISHTLGGGTEQHVEDLSRRLQAEGWGVYSLQRHNQDHLRLIACEQGEKETADWADPLFYQWPTDRAALVADLHRLSVAHLHLHHTVDLPEDFLHHFGEIVAEAALPFDYTVHDYFSICPRFTLFDEAVRGYCGEPVDVRKCSACVKHLGSAAGKNVDVAAWRQEYGMLLAKARKVFVPDADVATRLQRYFPNQKFTVRPHPENLRPPLEGGLASVSESGGVVLNTPEQPLPLRPSSLTLRRDSAALPQGEGMLRVVIVGGIAPHKGSKVLLDCAEDAARRNLPIHFTLIGYSDIDHKLKALKNVTVTGPFQPQELNSKLQAGEFHLAFLPSVIPETYNYVLSECWRHGLYVACLDIGAIASRIKAALDLGVVLPYEWYFQPQHINDALLALIIPPLPARLPLMDYPSITRDYYGL